MNASKDQHRERVRQGHNKWAHWYRHTINGFVLDYTPGFGRTENSTGKLLTYNPAHMQHMPGGLCTPYNRRLSVWGSWKRHWQTAIIALATAGSALLFDTYCGKECLYSDADDSKPSNQLMVVLKYDIYYLSNIFLRLSSFVVSAFVVLVVTRWYQRRLYYIALIGNLKAFTVLVMGLLEQPERPRGTKGVRGMPSPPEEELYSGPSLEQLQFARQARTTFARYVVAVLEFAILKQRGHMDTEEGFNYMSKEQLVMSREEWDMMVPGARHLTVLNWMTHLMRKCKNAGVLSELDQLTNLIERGRSNSSDMLDPTIYDLPYVSAAHFVTIDSSTPPPPPHISHYQKSISRTGVCKRRDIGSQDDVPRFRYPVGDPGMFASPP